VISVALKTSLKTRLGICIYIISLPHRPDDYIGFISAVTRQPRTPRLGWTRPLLGAPQYILY